MSSSTSWRPTRKWLATQCTATATLAVAWVNAGAWTKPLSIAAIGLVSQATVGYLVSNADPATTTAPGSGPAVSTSAGARSTVA